MIVVKYDDVLYRIAGKEYMFEVVTPNRTFYVQVDSQEDMSEWIRLFNDLLKSIRPTLQQHGQVKSLQWEVEYVTPVT